MQNARKQELALTMRSISKFKKNKMYLLSIFNLTGGELVLRCIVFISKIKALCVLEQKLSLFSNPCLIHAQSDFRYPKIMPGKSVGM